MIKLCYLSLLFFFNIGTSYSQVNYWKNLLNDTTGMTFDIITFSDTTINKSKNHLIQLTKLSDSIFQEVVSEINIYVDYQDTIPLTSAIFTISKEGKVYNNYGISFGENKSVGYLFNHKNNKKEGVATVFFDNRNGIERLQTYKNDTLNGTICYFYPDGKVKKIGKSFFILDLKIGEWKSYYENGKIKSIGSYGLVLGGSKDVIYNFEKIKGFDLYQLNSKKIGKWFYYHEEGGLIKEENYDY